MKGDTGPSGFKGQKGETGSIGSAGIKIWVNFSVFLSFQFYQKYQ